MGEVVHVVRRDMGRNQIELSNHQVIKSSSHRVDESSTPDCEYKSNRGNVKQNKKVLKLKLKVKWGESGRGDMETGDIGHFQGFTSP